MNSNKAIKQLDFNVSDSQQVDVDNLPLSVDKIQNNLLIVVTFPQSTTNRHVL